MQISAAGLELIRAFEGCSLKAYLDSVGVPTIGWGRTRHDDGTKIKVGDTCTQAEADHWLEEDAEKDGAHYVRAWAGVLPQHQFDALTSFGYNRGAGRLRELLATHDVEKNILKYDLAGDPPRKLEGLSRRRAAELLMYRGLDWREVDTVEKWKAWLAGGVA